MRYHSTGVHALHTHFCLAQTRKIHLRENFYSFSFILCNFFSFLFQDVDINGVSHQVGSAPRDHHDDDDNDDDGCNRRWRSGRWKAAVQDVAQTELETIQKSSDAGDRGKSFSPSPLLTRPEHVKPLAICFFLSARRVTRARVCAVYRIHGRRVISLFRRIPG